MSVGSTPCLPSLAQWGEAQGTTVLDNEHLSASSLRKTAKSKFLKSHCCKGQDASSEQLKDVLHISKKVGMMKGRT